MHHADAAQPDLLQGVIDRLRRARRAIHARLLVRDVLVAVAALGAALVVGRGVMWLAPQRVGPGGLRLALGTIAAAALGLALREARRTTPSLVDVARRAEVRFGLQERLSTALALGERRAAPRFGLERLLLADAAERAHAVEPRALADADLRPGAVWAAALLLAAAGAWAAPLHPRPTNSLPPAARAAAAAAPDPADVLRAAELVARDAGERDDPYLSAVAVALQDLGDRMARGDVTGSAAARALADLRVHLGRAYGDTPGAASAAATPGVPGAPGSGTIDPGAAAPPGAASATRTSTSADASGGPPPSDPQQSGPPTNEDASSLEGFVRQLEAKSAQAAGPVGAGARPRPLGAPSAAAQAAAAPSGYWQQNAARDAEIARTKALLERAGGAGGQPAGPAQDATAGAGDVAGAGLGGRGGADAAPDAAAPLEITALPSSALAGGTRIRLELAPDARRTNAQGTATRAAAARVAEPVGGGAYLDPGQRAAVARFFVDDGTAGAPGADASGGGATSGPP